MSEPCFRCGAPTRDEVLMRGGDHGWGDDASRTVQRYDAAVAPWPDFAGKPIRHGDRLRHPDGSTFVAFRLNGHEHESDAWRCVYDALWVDSSMVTSRLCLQIGDKGQAVVI